MSLKPFAWIRLALPLALLAGLSCNPDQTEAGDRARFGTTTVRAQSEDEFFDGYLLTGSTTEVIDSTAATPQCRDLPPAMTSPDAVFSPAPAAPPVSSLPAGQGALTAQNTVAAALMPGGYLDPAAPVTTFRLRFDSAVNNEFPDRGEYFYAQCGCFRQVGPPEFDPNADGPIGANTSVDYHDVRPYFEYAFNPRFSVFAELAVRFVDFESLPVLPALGSENGFSDMNIGWKYALIARPDEYLTFQMRTYLPTGDADRGLGTQHVSIEPSLLYFRQLSSNLLFQGQLTEFTPINGSQFASNVFQYGGGLGYLLNRGQSVTVMPTVEVVGWTFLDGQKFSPLHGQSSATGDTIVNLKPGVRVGLGDAGPMMMQRHSVYAGFGIPIASEEFYSSLFRVEYRVVF